MEIKRILAVDPGSKELGLYNGGSGCTFFAPEKAGRPERLADLGLKFTDFLYRTGPYDFVVYEEQFVRGGAATRALYGIVGIIECASVNAGAGVMPLPQGTLRKWAALEGKNGLKGKRLYEKVAIERDPRLGVALGVTEHVFDAACIYHFIQDRGKFNE